MELSLECPRCRGTKLIHTANPRGDEPVTCARCASVFPYGELEAQAVQAAHNLAGGFPATPIDKNVATSAE